MMAAGSLRDTTMGALQDVSDTFQTRKAVLGLFNVSGFCMLEAVIAA